MPQPSAATFDQPHILYRAYGASGQLIYVGITANWPKRLRNHECSTWWWKHEIVSFRLTLWPDRESALAAERRVIREEKPVRNQQHQSRRVGATRTQVYVRHADLHHSASPMAEDPRSTQDVVTYSEIPLWEDAT